MLKIYLIVSGICMMIFGVLGGRTKQENNRTVIPLLDKFQQHDYKINFERLEVVCYNDCYLKPFHVVTFKCNRTCTLINAIFSFWLYVMIFGVLGIPSKQKKITLTEVPFLDKFQQRDYKLDFERAEALRYNESYVKQWHVVTFKYNRTFAAVNITLECKVDIGHDLEIIAQAYKFASNEYRLFPVRFEINYCQAITKNVGGLQDIYKCGNFTGCSFLKGKPVKTCNWIPNAEKSPPLIPNGQYMVEFQGMHHSTEIFVIRGYATVSRPIPIPKH